MDGTLVDTEPYWMAAEIPLVESFGGTWTHEQALTLVGSGLEDSARILQAVGVDMGVGEIIDHLTAEVRRQLATLGVPFRPGAQELLRSLRDAGIPTALVTMSMRRMAEDIVSLIDFPSFDLIVAGDDVDRPKPHPEAYLKASTELGVDPMHTVALEDSPTGLRAAVSAGTVAIGVPHLVALDDAGAHELWPSLSGRTPEDVATLYRRHRPASAPSMSLAADRGDHA
ncbi:HAD family hydrolase [Microbacterium sp. S308A+]